MEELKIGDKVDLLVVKATTLGFTVMVNHEFEGLLYKSELFQKIQLCLNTKSYMLKNAEIRNFQLFQKFKTFLIGVRKNS